MSALKPLQFKKVLDNEGNFKYLEIWQDGQRICIEFSQSMSDGADNNFKWKHLRPLLERIANQVYEEAAKDLGVFGELLKQGKDE